MEYRALGTTEIKVSRCCLGTMTWGSQNSRDEAFEQMDYAVERGVNFFDTAEIYPVPPREEWANATETIIGEWLRARPGMREKIIIATKIGGPHVAWLRGDRPPFNKKDIRDALDASCKRLGVETIDLYQLHWPERHVNIFGRLAWTVPAGEERTTPFEETLSAFAELQKEGRVRAVGVSNETPWGVMRFLEHAEKAGLPRMASIQNPYSLLNRSFEVGLAEVAFRERCGLLAYAPFAAGVLSGKYLDGAKPKGARFVLYPQASRYFSASGEAAVRAWIDLAKRHEMDIATLAHAFVYSRPFLTSSIIGATRMDQLKAAIDAEAVTLSDELLAEIEEVHNAHTYPCP
ncbi:MAG: aldo/keto reductase [Alphaproteobacteria bacterium]|nr:aldo/keto reductase [Alphaproteobacteria bacterium]MDA7983364.1 aldo/keto reductase [Alphaproteobacteria bacterium]MDA7988433.1 aldo/keto reductase [Alphaproteobacteria bacterium]MDA8000565.1 aldo/keto reductase [Alphaproteobacteria bacterium]MDA8003665.1 aldo/keto reductase [Alphaproteobacteria bacterium]